MGWIIQIGTGDGCWVNIHGDISPEAPILFDNPPINDLIPGKVYMQELSGFQYRKVHTDPLVQALYEAQQTDAPLGFIAGEFN